MGIFGRGGKGSRVMAMQSRGMRTFASRATTSATHTMADHGGNGSREKVSRIRRGIDGRAMRGNYRGLEVVSRITEVGVGMVEVITQINAVQKPTPMGSAGAFS